MSTAYKGKLTNKELIGYGVGALGENMSFTLVNAFIMFFCTDLLGITAGFMASLLFAARIFDALNDPIMGTLTENTRTKWGKHRPWILLGGLSNLIVLVFLFNPDLAKAFDPRVYISVLYVIFGLTYTLIDVPYYAYAASFLDPVERDKISTAPRIFSGVAMLLVQALTITLIGKLSPNNEGQGFFRLSIIIAFIFIITTLITTSSMKKREISSQDMKFSFSMAFKTLKNNDQLLIIISVFTLIMIAPVLSNTVALYYFKYVWHDFNAFSIFVLPAGAGMAISLVAYPFAAKKISRRKVFIYSLLLSMAGYVSMFFTGYFGSTVFIMLPAVFLTFLGFGCMGIIQSVFLVDTVEYGEWKQGYRSENIVFAMLTFLGKFSGALAALIVGGVLQIVGYISTDEDVKGVFDEATEIIKQPDGVASALNILMFAVPPLLIAAALWLYLKKYRLYGDFMDEVTAALQAKREGQ